MTVRFVVCALCGVCFVLMSMGEATAQVGLQIPLQFDFLNPGARSLALGSAFAGLADDATAGFTNPAGLTILTLPEVSFEVRGRRLESPFLRGGRLSGPVTGTGVDTVAGPINGTSVAESTGVSYISFVLPRPKWSIAAYRHEFVRLAQEFESEGVFQAFSLREFALLASRNIDITSYGASGAYRVHPRVSIGGGVGVHQFKLEALFDRYFFLPNIYVDPTFSADTLIQHAEQQSDTTGVGFSLGGLFTAYQPADAEAIPNLVQLGAVYRKGASFDFESLSGPITNPVQRPGTFHTPDAVAAGATVRLTPSATVTGEVTWVQYSSLVDGYISSQSGSRPGRFTIDDGVEVHAGFEYVFNVRWLPALRVGAWRDPDHAVRYVVLPNPDLLDERNAAYLPDRAASMHYTFGAGVSFSRRFEANFGADLSERTRQISASAVLRFPR
jgi:long-chain fatty acid transport protein